jgi:hypothetical protein
LSDRAPTNVEIRAVFARNRRLGLTTAPYPREFAQPAAPTTLSRRIEHLASLSPAKHPDLVDVDPSRLMYSNRVGLRAAHHRLSREGK